MAVLEYCSFKLPAVQLRPLEPNVPSWFHRLPGPAAARIHGMGMSLCGAGHQPEQGIMWGMNWDTGQGRHHVQDRDEMVPGRPQSPFQDLKGLQKSWRAHDWGQGHGVTEQRGTASNCKKGNKG